MTKIRASKLCDACARWLLAVAIGCGGVRAASEVAAPSDAPPPRKPDAVVVEPPPALPRPVARAPARGVVSLREPAGTGGVVDLVQSFVDGWKRGSLDALLALVTVDAGPIEARARGRATLIEGWKQRLHSHEYARLDGVELVRPERIETWEAGELEGQDGPVPRTDVHAGELLVRAPLEVTRAGGEKLFGDVMLLVVRREGGKLRIAAYGEVDVP